MIYYVRNEHANLSKKIHHFRKRKTKHYLEHSSPGTQLCEMKKPFWKKIQKTICKNDMILLGFVDSSQHIESEETSNVIAIRHEMMKCSKCVQDLLLSHHKSGMKLTEDCLCRHTFIDAEMNWRLHWIKNEWLLRKIFLFSMFVIKPCSRCDSNLLPIRW